MKTLVRIYQSQVLKVLALLLVFLCSMPTIIFGQEKYPLNIAISNIDKIKGSLMLAVYTLDTKFLGEQFFASTSVRIANMPSQMLTIGLPLGVYAVAVYQDKNDDQKLNKNFLGMPTEPYGFSNNNMGIFGPPDFQSSAFDFTVADQTIEISL
ncbi:MAG: hypothetical protein ACJA08_003563 [Cyclobacteriaceae bacterium]|jgi:uncharacterized protein (DUF2141 family)